MNFSKLDDGRYAITDAELGIEFHVDRLRRERGGDLVGELTVACGILGAKVFDGNLSSGGFNFSSVQARSQRAKLLAERARTGGKVDWLERLEEVCQRVTSDERQRRSRRGAGRRAQAITSRRRRPRRAGAASSETPRRDGVR